MAGLVAGAMSMAAGEYVSVSTQRDSERALLRKEKRELREDPEDELAELAGLYVDSGLDDELALEVARQLTAKDALAAHAEVELGIDPDDLTSPWNAALASMVSFTLGALLPLLTISLVAESARVGVTVGGGRGGAGDHRIQPAPASATRRRAARSRATSGAGCSRWRRRTPWARPLGTRVD